MKNNAEYGQSPAGLVRKLYVPTVSIFLLLLVGNWLAARSQFDPLTIAQNRRIRFQTGDEDAARLDGLTAVEAVSANAVVRNGFKEARDWNGVLFVGNSQTLGIMDEKPGDLTTPQWLRVLLMRQTGRALAPPVVLGSLPNLSMSEFLLRLVAAGEWNPHPVRALVGCVTLREWRGLAVRDSLLPLAVTRPVRQALTRLVASSPDLQAADTAIMGSVRPAQSADSAPGSVEPQALAKRFEKTVQETADEMPLFRMRPYLYSRVHVYYMSLRNKLLNIHTDTPRPVPETTYRASLQLLELSLRYAQQRGITVVLYLSPIRPIEPNPVLSSDLAKFRKDVFDVCERYGVVCLDYTYLVPEKLWINYPEEDTVDRGERDYAHFTGPAHKLVAEHIMADAGARLLGSTQ